MGFGHNRKSAASGVRRVSLTRREVVGPRTIGGRLFLPVMLRFYSSLAVEVSLLTRAHARRATRGRRIVLAARSWRAGVPARYWRSYQLARRKRVAPWPLRRASCLGSVGLRQDRARVGGRSNLRVGGAVKFAGSEFSHPGWKATDV